MDYCHPCRRHLNGALACPGCGTPFEQLGSAEPPLTATGAVTPPRPAEDTDAANTVPDETPDDAPSGARSSRRDRKAAAHRRRRRRTLFVTAGFVLAAGGLSLAELGTDAPHSPPRPAAAGGETADGEATKEVGEGSALPADATSDRSTASDAPSLDASTSASSSPSKSPDADASDTPPESDTPAASRPPAQADTPTRAPDPAPSSPRSDDPPPTTTPTQPDEPTPTPTETCDRFLWWCT
ncbi:MULTISPECIES: hypothetical protein [unclassified Streptomyces]|uniref:SCO2400 family protein n=1 Tax=unclassified Streptomyces TaxID=2593676 RepID=UPI0035D9E330